MKKFTILAGTAVLGVAAAGIALAQPTDAPKFDRNADVTRQQVIERTDQRFQRLDADRDGSVSRAEFDQAQAQRMARRGERGEHGEHGRGMGGMHRGHGWGGMRGEQMFGEQGFVTREQMRERALARFDRADANRDGTLTSAERQQAREQFRQHRQERRTQTN